MDFLSQVGVSQLSGSFLLLQFPGKEMADQIATGLKVPGLATVSTIVLEWGGFLTLIITACRSSLIGRWVGNAYIEPHMGHLGQVRTIHICYICGSKFATNVF